MKTYNSKPIVRETLQRNFLDLLLLMICNFWKDSPEKLLIFIHSFSFINEDLNIAWWFIVIWKFEIEVFSSVLKRIFILGRIEYRILFVWWKLNESNIEYYSLIKKIFEYYSNTWKYLNIQIYSNKFAKNCIGFGIKNFYIPWKHLLIKKNFPHVDSHQ